MPEWYAVISPGLEPALQRELQEVLPEPPTMLGGGARFTAPLREGALLASTLRTPARLLLELIEGQATTLEGLATLVKRVDWRPFLHPSAPLEVAVTATKSRLRFRDNNSHKVEMAIRDALRGPRLPSLRTHLTPQRISVKLENDRALISLDVGGELLHTRGWRQSSTRAPLRENLAASCLVLAGWTGQVPLLDPFCGSGTIPIEAALLASGRPPWMGRRFAWQSWPAMSRVSPPDPRRTTRAIDVSIIGSDRDEQALTSSAENANRAGLRLKWNQADIAELTAPAPTGLILTNPPYGQRLGQNVEGVYVNFGRTLRARFGGWRVLFLCPDRKLASLVDRSSRSIAHFSNGGIRVNLYEIMP